MKKSKSLSFWLLAFLLLFSLTDLNSAPGKKTPFDSRKVGMGIKKLRERKVNKRIQVVSDLNDFAFTLANYPYDEGAPVIMKHLSNIKSRPRIISFDEFLGGVYLVRSRDGRYYKLFYSSEESYQTQVFAGDRGMIETRIDNVPKQRWDPTYVKPAEEFVGFGAPRNPANTGSISGVVVREDQYVFPGRNDLYPFSGPHLMNEDLGYLNVLDPLNDDIYKLPTKVVSDIMDRNLGKPIANLYFELTNELVSRYPPSFYNAVREGSNIRSVIDFLWVAVRGHGGARNPVLYDSDVENILSLRQPPSVIPIDHAYSDAELADLLSEVRAGSLSTIDGPEYLMQKPIYENAAEELEYYINGLNADELSIIADYLGFTNTGVSISSEAYGGELLGKVYRSKISAQNPKAFFVDLKDPRLAGRGMGQGTPLYNKLYRDYKEDIITKMRNQPFRTIAAPSFGTRDKPVYRIEFPEIKEDCK